MFFSVAVASWLLKVLCILDCNREDGDNSTVDAADVPVRTFTPVPQQLQSDDEENNATDNQSSLFHQDDIRQSIIQSDSQPNELSSESIQEQDEDDDLPNNQHNIETSSETTSNISHPIPNIQNPITTQSISKKSNSSISKNGSRRQPRKRQREKTPVEYDNILTQDVENNTEECVVLSTGHTLGNSWKSGGKLVVGMYSFFFFYFIYNNNNTNTNTNINFFFKKKK